MNLLFIKNFQKTILAIIFIILISCNPNDKINIENYIDIAYFYNENNGQTFSHLSPIIIEIDDSIGLFIKKHKPRFNYLIFNKINKDTLKYLYPDTLAIKMSLKKQINDKQFISNFSKLANPKKRTNEIYSMNEIMKVASRFFVVVNSRNDFRIKVCAGGNDFQDLNETKDVSLIESLSYEAITSIFRQKKEERPKFISNVRTCFSDAIKNPDSLSNEILLKSARNKLYKMMEQDKS